MLHVMAIRDQSYVNVSKERTLLADTDVAPPHDMAKITTGKCFHREMNCNKNATFI